MLGHYTHEGNEFKKIFFPDGYDGFDMSWFVTEDMAYGGRKGLIKLIKYIMTPRKKNYPKNNFNLNECTTNCRTVKGVMIRSCSILTKGEVLKLNAS
jgi:hypothetical protein